MSQVIRLHHGDSFEVLREMEPRSIGAVVCDPPYGISFMGRDWDTFGGVNVDVVAFKKKAALDFQVWCVTWLKECYRILTPGGVIKTFSATRTYHRLAQAMVKVGFENLGFEAWVHGQGFPKSLNVSKAIDKHMGVERTQVIGEGTAGAAFHYGNPGEGGFGLTSDSVGGTPSSRWLVTAAETPEAVKFEGWGTALKPAWEIFLVGRKSLTA